MHNFINRIKQQESQPNLFKSIILYVVIPGGLAILAVHTLFPEIEYPPDPVSHALLLKRAGFEERAENHLRQSLSDYEYNLIFHRVYLQIYFEGVSPYAQTDAYNDDHVQKVYEKLLAEAKGDEIDRANYLLGLFWSHKGHLENALEYYQKVQNRDLPFLNNSIGHLLAIRGNHRDALPYFQRALDDDQSMETAVYNLSVSLLAEKNWSAIGDLISHETHAQFVPRHVQQTLSLHQGKYGAYVANHLRSFVFQPNWLLIAIACVGGILWFYVIRWWDLYEKESLIISACTVIAGAFFSSFVFVVRNVLDLLFNIDLTGQPLNDFLYCVVIIGLVEEAIKFFPVILVRVFTKRINEPVDWIVYACLSALGFAVWENYEYMTIYGSSVALPRTFLSLPFHLYLSGTIAIMVAEARLRKRNPLLMFTLALGFSSLAHGIFDFMLLGPWNFLSFFAFFFVIYFALFFLNGLTNVQAASPFKKAIEEKVEFNPWLFRCFFTLWILVYFSNSLVFPPDLSTAIFLGSDLVLNAGIIWSISIYSYVMMTESWDPDWYKKVFAKKDDSKNVLGRAETGSIEKRPGSARRRDSG